MIEISKQKLAVVAMSFTLAMQLPVHAFGEQRAPRNMVTRSETAVAIATAIADEAYGKDVISKELPLIPELKGDAWHVSGQFKIGIPGGIVEVWLSARDGRVIKLTHGM